jgi:hypothetical protein
MQATRTIRSIDGEPETSALAHEGRLRQYGLVAAVYLCAIFITNAHFQGDTLYYVNDILAGTASPVFWEFGHLLWRPLGWLLSQSLVAATGLDRQAGAAFVLTAINWIAGLSSVLLLRALAGCVTRREWVANTVTAAFIFSQGFLNYAHTGCSYVPGLSLLLLGLYILAKNAEEPERSLRAGLAAGAALAGAVCFWFLYLWAIPAAVLSPLFLFGFSKERLRFVVQTSLAFALVTGLVYGAVLASLGIFTVSGLKAWIAMSSHGIVNVNGFSRMVFGFARSFINMGQDGMIFKRFIVHDPINPVSLFDLFRLSLWKFALFYLFLASVLAALLGSNKGRRVAGLFFAGAVPVLGFAIFWQGGDMERYLPLYPFIFLTLAYALSSKSTALFKYVALAFVIAVVFSNALALSRITLDRHNEAVAARISQLQSRLTPHSRALTVKDELERLQWDSPFNPINANLKVESVVTPGLVRTPKWRQETAEIVLATWRDGGEVWVANRLLAARPRSEWGWVEGDDARVSWSDIYGFFSRFEMGESVGGEDGFTLLPASPANRELLSRVAGENQQASPATAPGVDKPRRDE